MKARLLTLAGMLALVMAVLSRGEGPSAGPRATRAPAAPEASAPASSRDEASPAPVPVEEPIAVPARDVFRYADRPAAAVPSAPRPLARSTAPATSEPSPSSAPAVRLVGLLSKGGTLQAALSIEGEVWVAGLGEAVGGYTVVSLDEGGVRLRGPDGGEIVLELSN